MHAIVMGLPPLESSPLLTPYETVRSTKSKGKTSQTGLYSGDRFYPLGGGALRFSLFPF